MRKHLMPEMKEGGVNVTPLIDIVMCLIIFFMLVAKIGVDTGGEKMDIPTSMMGNDIKDMGNTLILNVRPGPADQPFVTALVRGQKQELKVEEPGTQRRPLLDALKFVRYGADMKTGGAGANIDNPEFKIIIRGEQNMDYRFLEPVLITCAEAGVKSVNFNTKIPEKVVAAGAVE